MLAAEFDEDVRQPAIARFERTLSPISSPPPQDPTESAVSANPPGDVPTLSPPRSPTLRTAGPATATAGIATAAHPVPSNSASHGVASSDPGNASGSGVACAELPRDRPPNRRCIHGPPCRFHFGETPRPSLPRPPLLRQALLMLVGPTAEGTLGWRKRRRQRLLESTLETQGPRWPLHHRLLHTRWDLVSCCRLHLRHPCCTPLFHPLHRMGGRQWSPTPLPHRHRPAHPLLPSSLLFPQLCSLSPSTSPPMPSSLAATH